MRIVVQKFGGTSVSTPELRRHVVRRVQDALRDGLAPVVVVSAMGRRGDPYATDTLIELADSIGGRPNDRELALLLSCGEVIATVVIAHTLERAGIEAQALTGGEAGIITDENYLGARVLEVRPKRVVALCESGIVPVIAGFQGIDSADRVTTLGRGGSDTTAAVLGVALRAERVDIFTDVDGMKTADPRLEPAAATLRSVSYQEAMQMAHLGAKVVHPRAVEVAMQGRLSLVVRSTTHDGNCTCIGGGDGTEPTWSDRLVTAVTHVAGLAQIRLGRQDGEPQATAVFTALAARSMSLDMLWVSPEQIAFVVEGERAKDAERVLSNFQPQVQVRTEVAKVSVVGAGMHGVPGVMAKITTALDESGIEILQSVDSHVNISCLVDERGLEAAVRALHAAFSLEQPQ